MSIKTQQVKIFENSDVLNAQVLEVPVHQGEKILSHEPYVPEAMKMYDRYCSPEVMKSIASYEEAGNFRDVCEGYVSSYNEKQSTAQILLSSKHEIMVDINPNESINTGDKIDVVVTKKKGHFSGDASSKTAQVERLKQELIKQIDNPTSAYNATVKEIVYNSSNVFNGFMVDIKGVKCFMPGTESDVVPLNDFKELVGKDMYVMPINIIKDSIIVSHKEYLNTLKPRVLDKLADIEKGTVVTGTISSVKKFGLFILIESCVATLLSVSEMNEVTESKFKAGELKVGDNIDFYIDNISDGRVIVTQTVSKSEGWDNLKEAVTKNENYKLKGVVKNIFDNGVVIISEEFNNITFFLSSKVVVLDDLKVGNEVVLPVESVDTVKKTVRLKIKQ